MPHSPLSYTLVCSEKKHVGLVVENFSSRTSDCIESVGVYWEKEWWESQRHTQLSVVWVLRSQSCGRLSGML
jgi:hypothetical protein